VGHQLQREEGEGVQRRMPSISSGLPHIRQKREHTLAMGATLYDLVAIRATFIVINVVVVGVDRYERDSI